MILIKITPVEFSSKYINFNYFKIGCYFIWKQC